jgi:hypothetical protein
MNSRISFEFLPGFALKAMFLGVENRNRLEKSDSEGFWQSRGGRPEITIRAFFTVPVWLISWFPTRLPENERQVLRLSLSQKRAKLRSG